LIEKRGLHRLAIKLAVGLRAWTANGGAVTSIENAKLDSRGIGYAPHNPIQRVDLAHEMAFAQTPYGGIAGHFPDGFDFMSQEERPRTKARSGGGGLASRVASAYNDDIERKHRGQIVEFMNESNGNGGKESFRGYN